MADWLATQRGISLKETEQQILYIIRDLADKNSPNTRASAALNFQQLLVEEKLGQETKHDDDDMLSYCSDSEGRPDLDTYLAIKRGHKIGNAQPGRAGVSAEAYGKHNTADNWKAREIPKTYEVRVRITNRLSNNFMFSDLDEKEKSIVVNAMDEKFFA